MHTVFPQFRFELINLYIYYREFQNQLAKEERVSEIGQVEKIDWWPPFQL